MSRRNGAEAFVVSRVLNNSELGNTYVYSIIGAVVKTWVRFKTNFSPARLSDGVEHSNTDILYFVDFITSGTS